MGAPSAPQVSDPAHNVSPEERLNRDLAQIPAKAVAERLDGHALRQLRAWIDLRLAEISGTPTVEGGAEELSEREAAVLRRVALGYSNKETASHMRCSVKTVVAHKGRALKKLKFRTRVQLMRYATQRGWLNPE